MSLTTGVPNLGLAYPGIDPRLATDGLEGLAAYRAGGGYALVADVEQFLAAVEESGLRGRGGAAFPTGRKLRTVRSGTGFPVVVANGEEGEPASVKDRWLLRCRPHLVLDGLRLAALAVGTKDAYVYVSDPLSASAIERALAELSGSLDLRVTVTRVDPTYVAGEETAAVQAINGGAALPTDKPPRPFEAGVAGRPTLINNVETLANLPFVQRRGAAAYREVGTGAAPGTFLMTLSGARSGLYEVPFGSTLRDVLTWVGEDVSAVKGFLMGGYFAGVIGPHALDLPLDYDSFAAAGSGLGCGAVVVIGRDTCPVAVSAGVMTYFARENAGQCGSCFNGTVAMSAVTEALRDHRAEESDVERLRDWSVRLRGRGACGTLDGATNVAASLLREFPDLVATHLHGRCDSCDGGRHPADPPFAVTLPTEE
ncbi:NADH:ubiquinone oxidoreductase subunit F (NADH-binding) [Kribbella sp. VKM Ac-2527]|uniref:NADH:ubiquinone oxidoreductase subunit F (NADH-binding) n=1 Tax=Kribbella caucasensis TaxID=2512215 RepID=A0A4R6KD60_9ACTN|nr:NADH-ubiquinone oxidoreductase-F iron-sulfur binding region domain-containing protein [Kribbella sp. VKM Ac-2527]TDO46405.1 NADH:ubiquinone oxidoreductase subunit F (NADH-binding) [Kribbella sp. VKM Ac-2527]